jgi:hypothetical protein
MIDQLLINSGVSSAQASLNNATPITNDLCQVNQVFPRAVINKLETYLSTNSEQPWESEVSAYSTLDHNQNRKKLAWHAETVVEELHEICNGLSTLVFDKFSLHNHKFLGITIWQDSPEYFLDWHVDNDMVAASLQVYLFGNQACPGTTFMVNDREFNIDFCQNSGYLVYHNPKHQLMHKVSWPVPNNTVRYSLFAMWSKVGQESSAS